MSALAVADSGGPILVYPVDLALEDQTAEGARLDSHFECDTQLRGEHLDWCFEAEAFSRRCVKVPDDAVNVVIAVTAEACLARYVSALTASFIASSSIRPAIASR